MVNFLKFFQVKIRIVMVWVAALAKKTHSYFIAAKRNGKLTTFGQFLCSIQFCSIHYLVNIVSWGKWKLTNWMLFNRLFGGNKFVQFSTFSGFLFAGRVTDLAHQQILSSYIWGNEIFWGNMLLTLLKRCLFSSPWEDFWGYFQDQKSIESPPRMARVMNFIFDGNMVRCDLMLFSFRMLWMHW